MKVLITGSSGFIGSYLVKYLSEFDTYKLFLIDKSNGIDICNWEQVKNFSGFDVLVHLANKSYVPDSYEDPGSFYSANFISTLNALELCRINKSRFIYLSSYVYGHPDYQPIDECHEVRPFNPYAQSKLICEKLAEGYNRDFKVPALIFRPFNIYGAGQNKSFLIPSIIFQSESGKITIRDERPQRDYLHVLDLVRAIKLAIEHDFSNSFEILNIGYGKSYSVKHIVQTVQSLSKNNVSYSCLNEYRPNEVLDTVADISKIKRILRWEPTITFEDGLKLLISE